MGFIAFQAELLRGNENFTDWEDLDMYSVEMKNPIGDIFKNETSFIHFHQDESPMGPRTIWMRVGLTQEIAQFIRKTKSSSKTPYDQPDVVAVSSDNSIQFMVSEHLKGPRANFNLLQSHLSENQSDNLNVREVEEVLLIFLLRPCQSHHVDYQMWFEYGNPEHPLLVTKIKYRICLMFECNNCGLGERFSLFDHDSGVKPKYYTIFRSSASEPEPCIVEKESKFSAWDLVPVVGSIRTMREGCKKFEEGSMCLGSAYIGFGIACLASDISLFGGISSFVKGALVGAGKVATKTAVSTAAKQGAKRVVKGMVIHAAQEAGHSFIKDIAKKVDEQAAKERRRRGNRHKTSSTYMKFQSKELGESELSIDYMLQLVKT